MSTRKSLGRCHGVPQDERARAQKSLMAGAKPMSSNGEQVANDVVDREEPLGVCQDNAYRLRSRADLHGRSEHRTAARLEKRTGTP